ncbi:MAG: TIGR01244 family sulfur transferase [Paracoccaceae bacterium]|nr:TIGR01244 family sulfur transferase [Paracoccaceae bacterium]
MDRRQITDAYSVSPQIEPGDVAALAADGVRVLINNRPDAEVPPELQSDAIRQAAEAAGLAFLDNPVVHGALTLEIVERQKTALDGAGGPVHAYCASGNRSTIVWGLGVAGEIDTDAIIARAAAAGYTLEGLRPQLDALARQRAG